MNQALEITTQIGCSNVCGYCPQDKLIAAYSKKSKVRRMSFDAFKECIDKLPDSVNIHFSGMSEPWLNPDCTKMLLYAHQRGHQVRVFTTLVGMTLEDFETIESVPLASFWVHLPSVQWSSKIRITEDYLKLLERVASSTVINASFGTCQGEAFPVIKLILGYHQKKIIRYPLTTRAGNIFVNGVRFPEREDKVLGCNRDLRQNVLLPNGDVLLCCMDYGMRHVLGNLLAQDYEDLYKGEEFLKVERGACRDSADILCKTCEYAIKKTPVLL